MFFTQYRRSVAIPARTLWVSSHHVFHVIQAFSGYTCPHFMGVQSPCSSHNTSVQWLYLPTRCACGHTHNLFPQPGVSNQRGCSHTHDVRRVRKRCCPLKRHEPCHIHRLLHDSIVWVTILLLNSMLWATIFSLNNIVWLFSYWIV